MKRVYFGCKIFDDKELYVTPCSHCGKTYELALPKGKMLGGIGGRIPVCPYCNDIVFTSIRNGFPQMYTDGRIDLHEELCGAYTLTPLYSLYPEISGEKKESRAERIISRALSMCSDINGTKEEIEELVEKLYAKNPYIVHDYSVIIKVIFGMDENAKEEAIKRIEEIGEYEPATVVLRKFGVATKKSAAIIDDTPVPPVFLQNGLGITPGKTEPPHSEEGKNFCAFCKIRFDGRFCPECGGLPEK